MPAVRVRLSILVSVLLLSAAMLTSGLIFVQELRGSQETIRTDSVVRLNALATQLQNVLYSRVADDRRPDALMSLSVAAMTPGVRVILLTDGDDRAILSSHYAWTGDPAGRWTAYDASIAAQVRQSNSSLVVEPPGKEALRLGYYPIVIGYRDGGAIKTFGVLYIEFDMTRSLALARDGAMRHAASYIALTFASTLVIGLLLHVLIARRVAIVAAASERLAAGDLTVRTALEGSDEIARLGRTFDHMVEELGQEAGRRKEAENQIRRLAYFDPLTQLPNRRLLLDRLGHALAASDRSQQFGALIMLDLDHFKKLNDTKGHAVGDRLLVEVAARLSLTVRAEDTVARLGGDEFVIIAEGLGLQELTAGAAGEQVARKIRDALGRPFDLGAAEYHSTPSIGMTLFRGREVPLEVLITQADVALYQAKDAGRNVVRLFSPAAQEAIDRRLATEGALRRALARNEFRLYYQPQVDETGRRIGAEALIRWFDPERGLVMPGEFIAVAEDMGLIIEIGGWVLARACEQLRQWALDPATRGLRLSVNVSARQFHQPDFVPQVRRSLETTGANPRLLELELTESIVLEDFDGVAGRMSELSLLGVRFALDDFGTGYSSLSYLKRLPFHQIKIDQSFTRDVVHDPNDAAIVQAILAMSRALELQVMAEGVETVEQRDFLLRHGCRAFQGYLFGRPMPVELWPAGVPA